MVLMPLLSRLLTLLVILTMPLFLARLTLIPIKSLSICFSFFFQAEDGIRDLTVTGVQTCALPISGAAAADGGTCRCRFGAQPRFHGTAARTIPPRGDGARPDLRALSPGALGHSRQGDRKSVV